MNNVDATTSTNQAVIARRANPRRNSRYVAARTIAKLTELVESNYPGLGEEFFAVYPVADDSEASGAYLDSVRDAVFTLPMRQWAQVWAGRLLLGSPAR